MVLRRRLLYRRREGAASQQIGCAWVHAESIARVEPSSCILISIASRERLCTAAMLRDGDANDDVTAERAVRPAPSSPAGRGCRCTNARVEQVPPRRARRGRRGAIVSPWVRHTVTGLHSVWVLFTCTPGGPIFSTPSPIVNVYHGNSGSGHDYVRSADRPPPDNGLVIVLPRRACNVNAKPSARPLRSREGTTHPGSTSSQG